MPVHDFIDVILLFGLLLLAALIMSSDPAGQVNIIIPENVTANTTHGDAPLTVEFSYSGNGTQAWDFDSDGNIDFIGKNPTFKFSVQGNYTMRIISIF